MSPTQPILIEILAQIQFRIMAKQQWGLTKTDSVEQNKPGVIKPVTDECPVEVRNNETLLEERENE